MSATLAEIPPPRQPNPYPASGWRPQKPFILPVENTPLNNEQQRQPLVFVVDISKERVDFVGQIQDNSFTNTNEPINNYWSPNNRDNDFLKVQMLPNIKKPQSFKNQYQFKPNFFPQQQFLASEPMNSTPFYLQQGQITKPAQQYSSPHNVNYPNYEEINPVFPDPRKFSESHEKFDSIQAVKTSQEAIEAYNNIYLNGRQKNGYAEKNIDNFENNENFVYNPAQVTH